MDIIFVTTAKTDEEASELLTQLECHLESNEEGKSMAKKSMIVNNNVNKNSPLENTIVAEFVEDHMHI